MTEEKTRVVTLRMPMDLYERLAALAEKDRRSMNAEALVLLDEAMSVRVKPERKVEEYQPGS